MKKLVIILCDNLEFFVENDNNLIPNNQCLEYVQFASNRLFWLFSNEALLKFKGKRLTHFVIDNTNNHYWTQYLNENKLMHLDFYYVDGSCSLKNLSKFSNVQVLTIRKSYKILSQNQQLNSPDRFDNDTMMMIMEGCLKMKVFNK